MQDDSRQAGTSAEKIEGMKMAVAAILKAEIGLAKPEDLGFLESQVPYIAAQVVETILAYQAGETPR